MAVSTITEIIDAVCQVLFKKTANPVCDRSEGNTR